MFFDSHCHLDMDHFADDLGAVVARAREAGVSRMVSVASEVARFDAALDIARRFEGVSAAFGFSPFEADAADPALLAPFLDRPEAVAVGECGLDYYHDIHPPELQKEAFRLQLRMAAERGLPVIVHCRDAWGDMRFEIDAAARRFPGLRGVLHCFTGTLSDARFFLDRGFLVSFAGNLTYRRSDELRRVLLALPRDSVLFETDSPYLAPEPLRGRRNEPANVARTVAFAASLFGEDAAVTGKRAFRAASRLFGLEEVP